MKLNTRTLVYIALLVALEIVLTRFLSINTPLVRIGFQFLPIAIMGILFGPVPAAIGAVIADLIGATLFPSGPFFPGFTLNAALNGVIFGLFLHRKEIKLAHIIGAAVTITLVITLGLTPLWLSILFGKAFIPLMMSRIVQAAFMLPVMVLTIYVVQKRVLTLPLLMKERRAN